MGRRLELEGRRFGRRTVLRLSHIEKTNAFWVVRCDCGNESKVDGHTLNRGKAWQCNDCRLKDLWESNKNPDAAFLRVFKMYKRNAKEEKRPFNLTERQFRKLTSSPCFFTGRPPSNVKKTEGGSTYVYNGIDRLDNTKGYTKQNCVSCCWIANKMKGSMSSRDFISVCLEVSKIHVRRN